MRLSTLLRHLSWPELRHNAGRHAVAVLAVMLGVALAFSVHLINASALSEFGAAVRSVNGEPDLSLRAVAGSGFDETVYGRVATHPQVALASPVIEVDTYALDAQGQRVALRVLGLDALVAPALSPSLLPEPAADAGRLAMLDPGAVFLNPAARAALKLPRGDPLRVQSGLRLVTLRIAGGSSAPGAPLAVMDLAGAQQAFDRLGRLSRIDLRFTAGADPPRVLRELALPADVRAATPAESAQRLSNVSRAYRVNLTVLALVALFTGAFLVFSVLSLSVAKRQPQFALLGVLGLGARERLHWVLAESALLGLVGSALGIALGTALAQGALRWLGGDLGGGYFAGVAPQLQFGPLAALVYGGLGVVAALVGGWLPARAAQRIAPAQALKGLGDAGARTRRPWLGPLLMLAGALLALAPPIAGLPIAAYVAVAVLLVGGIACVPAGVGLLLRAVRRPTSRHAGWLLATQRARHLRASATVAVAGVVASLALAVALTVMVASFRDAVSRWLDTVLPADLYVRTATVSASNDTAWLPPDFVARAGALPGVRRLETLRALPLSLDPARPPPVLIARPLADAQRTLPMVGELLPAAPGGEPGVYVSEAMVALYGAAPGTRLVLPLTHRDGSAVRAAFFVRGVWRDYARQQGAVAIDTQDFVALTGDTRVNDLALTLAPGTDLAALQQALRALAPDPALIEFAQAGEIRASSLRIFDRSFAVTYWLQAVAIAIGLFGIAASFSAQVLARRKEFGLLAHLGFTRGQVLAIVAGEGVAWTAAGALLGLGLGLAVSVVLVHVVNPQSFHWTMELLAPWGRLAALCAAVVAAGTLTAAIAARRAVSQDAVLAVKEDW
ncbi:FtsX-like permease family protein [Methylibium sp. Root1272]|uniref:FtsX-like permease family protein n=1 Tax=Methylibium sp. Root1272 TaxID=1736441 RepID=UPI0006FCEA9A|nr:FtsX-like permease family protein [Methylibium sp. Root1272]KQW76309.1 ABC transporter permease [Methylibium sp. Root1272]